MLVVYLTPDGWGVYFTLNMMFDTELFCFPFYYSMIVGSALLYFRQAVPLPLDCFNIDVNLPAVVDSGTCCWRAFDCDATANITNAP